uniref:Uncharacterized protein n=1 Tax=Fagus sylvatica TaxID=28930 RepID=A0A2N9I0J5_FAGSY
MKEKVVAGILRISMVDSGSGFSKEKACLTLPALSFTKENAWMIGSRGGISSLLEICQAGFSSFGSWGSEKSRSVQ